MERELIHWQRTLRTPSSERYLALQAGTEVAAADLHFIPDGTVAGTVILLRVREWPEPAVQALLRSLDEDFLPDVDLARSDLTFTVVLGDVVGNFDATPQQKDTVG